MVDKEKKGKQKRKKSINGSGSVFHRGDGRWSAKFLVEETGKYKFLYASSEKEAWTKLDKALFEQKQGKLAVGPQRKLKEYLIQWLDEVQKSKLKISSYMRYKKTINGYIIPALGHLNLQKLTPQQVQAFYTQKLNDGLSSKSVNAMHGVLHAALDNAVRWNLVNRNVCDLVTPPSIVSKEIQTLTLEQAQKLLHAAKGHRLEAILTLALTTGMRRGELLALRWSDIDFKHQNLQVRRTVDFIAPHGYVETEPKTAKSRRKIALPPFVIDMLGLHRLHQNEQRLAIADKWEEKDLVFTGLQGGYLNPRYILKLFDKLLKEAGLPHIRFHDLRHSAATLLLAMGVHPKIVQEILGHSQISMTLDTYSHVLPSLQQEVMEKWGRLFQNNDDNDGEANKARET